VAGEEAPQRADREVVAVIGQPGTDFDQRQIVPLGNQDTDPVSLGLDTVR